MAGFDPFAWFEQYVPAGWLHRGIRLAGAVLCGGFVLLRVRQYDAFALKPLWVVETAVFVVLAWAFCSRLDPVDRSRGAREILVPLVGGLLPFGLLFSPPNSVIAGDRVLLLAVFWWMTLATALTVWGIATLRRSFSITIEARALVTGGPYRWVRHPVYLGEILTAAAVAAWRFSALNLAVLATFVGLQLLRARWEEGKLARNFERYEAFRRRSWWFW